MPETRRHLFLTGDKQVGKSTLLRRLIDAKNLDCAGFETRMLCVDGRKLSYILHARVDMPPYENDCLCCVRTGEKTIVPVLPVFEENGVSILQRSLSSPAPIILMDELGRLERDASGFLSQVFACLDSGKRCIGVLQRCSAPHIDQIAAREDVQVVTVTTENRDALFEELKNLF